MPRWSSADRLRALTLRAQGLSVAEVAARVGCHPTTIYAWARAQAAAEGRTTRGVLPAYPAETRKRALALNQTGEATISEVAEEAGVAKSTVQRWLAQERGARTP